MNRYTIYATLLTPVIAVICWWLIIIRGIDLTPLIVVFISALSYIQSKRISNLETLLNASIVLSSHAVVVRCANPKCAFCAHRKSG